MSMSPYAPTEMAPRARKIVKLVYARMIRAQVDATEGKLVKNDVIILDEDKAMRWVYRARIAVPATQQEYDDFQERFRRTRNGTRRLRAQPLAAPRPQDSPFTYVDETDPDFQSANQKLQPEAYAADGSRLDAGEYSTPQGDNQEPDESWEHDPNSNESQSNQSDLSSQLELAAGEDEYRGEPVADYSDEDDRPLDDDEGEGGVYGQSIESGPGSTPVPPRGRRAARR